MSIIALIALNGLSIATMIGASIGAILVAKITRIIEIYTVGEPVDPTSYDEGNGSSSNPPDPAGTDDDTPHIIQP